MIYEHICPHNAACSAVFDQKQCDPHVPPSLFTLSHPKRLYFVPQMKKVLKEKHFANMEGVKQKIAETVTGIKTDEFKTRFEQWEKCLDRCIAQRESYSKVTEV